MEKISIMDRTFRITEPQNLRIREFKDECLSDKAYDGVNGGRFTYCFTPTSLGIVIKVKDCISKREIDVSDYDSW